MILEAYDRGFITQQERDEGSALGRRTIAAAVRFRLYLLNTPTPARSRTPRTNAPAP